MNIQITGVSTPLSGTSQEHIRNNNAAIPLQINPTNKINVFISSKCGEKKYDTIRTELKTAIEATALATVYLFEATGASSQSARDHYTYALEDSDICIFLIDNKDGIPSGVQNEIDVVQKAGIKALYYFCDENSTKKTPLEQSLMGASCAKSKTVHAFSDLSKDGAKALIDDIITVYHNYCKRRLIPKREERDEEFQHISIADIERLQHPTIPKTILQNIDKCRDYILKFVTGHPYVKFPDEAENSNDIDEWCAQFLTIMFDGVSVKQFNATMFLDALKAYQTDEFHQIIQLRWIAIQSYFLGDIEKCITQLETALSYAKKTAQPAWVINDILIDLRNQHQIQDASCNVLSESEAQKKLSQSNEAVYHPVLDRVNSSLHGKYIESLFKNKIKSPYTVTYGNELKTYSELLASSYIISMYNGSLTHLMLFYEKVKDFLFFLCCKYNDWCFRRDMLKLAIYAGNEKEAKGIQAAYPEILNRLSAADAELIIQFCENQPVPYKRTISRLLALNTVGYYLDDNAFKKFEDLILSEIDAWLDDANATCAIGQSVFSCLYGVAYRMSQDVLSEICCKLMEKQYGRWLDEMFKFIESYIDVRKMSEDSAKQLVSNIAKLLADDKYCKIVQRTPRFLHALRKQDRNLTEELDKKIAETLPEYYNGIYKLETTTNAAEDLPIFLQQYVEQVGRYNELQGKNGMHFSTTRNIAIIRAILLSNKNKYAPEIMDSIIATVIDTLLISREGIATKLDAISLLACIVVRYPEDYNRNMQEFQRILEYTDEIPVGDYDFPLPNIDQVSLKICLQFLLSAMGADTYANILELMPYIQGDVPTTISVTRVLAEYLEAADNAVLQPKIEAVILQNVLQWLNSNQLDIRWNATKILLKAFGTAENAKIMNHQLISLVDSDNVYIKNLVMRNIYKVNTITAQTREYIISKCEHDPCFVVRMVCSEVKQKHRENKS